MMSRARGSSVWMGNSGIREEWGCGKEDGHHNHSGDRQIQEGICLRQLMCMKRLVNVLVSAVLVENGVLIDFVRKSVLSLTETLETRT